MRAARRSARRVAEPRANRVTARLGTVAATAWLVALALGCGGGGGDGEVDPAGSVECTEEDRSTLRCDVTLGERCCAAFDAQSSCAAACDGDEEGFGCDGPEDCPGGVCCAFMLSASSCAPTCEDSSETRMCTSGADCPADAACCLPTRINGVLLAFCSRSDLPSCR